MSPAPADAPPDHRLFFALYPETAQALPIAALASRLKLQLGLKGRPHDLARFHVTLHHLGDFVGMPEELCQRAERAAATLRQSPIALRFDQLLSFERRAKKNRPLVLSGGAGLDAVREFRRRLGEALAAAGIATDPRFTPHLTLMYDDELVPPQAIEAPAWHATEFALVDSLIGQHRHIKLARWPLQG
ncbi:2'-5' RNA ligase family protein [Roseateles violae]|uniref:2'-5' RNA ligase family protein n=1 Tax=Roseateles violae TaxID=3058042 RepID=A0ABT8DXL4_9BURK|nr:2'-5' RNA ligase family protein [Pelomonas sp. PFR6]MDN3922069.1 2'-5' RNA ligase family protein [Pelomonas sp. PFR6]